MPLWMQLLQNGGILQNPADGEGGDLGGGAAPAADPKEGEENADPKEGEEDPKEGEEGKKGQGSQLTDKEATLLKDVMKQKEAAKKAKADLEAFKAQVGDIDLAKARELIAAQKDAETKALEEKGEYERVKQSMAEQHKAEVAALQAKIDALKGSKSESEQRIADLTVGTRFSQSQFIAEELVLPPAKARALYGEHFEIEDGKVVGYDKPRGAADRTVLVDSYGQALGFDESMRKIIEADPEKDHLIKSKAKQGAGSNSAPKGTNGNLPPKQLTGQEKIHAGLANLLKK